MPGTFTQNSSFDLPTLSALRIQMSLSPFHWTDWVNLGLLPLTPTSRLLYCGLSMPEKVADTWNSSPMKHVPSLLGVPGDWPPCVSTVKKSAFGGGTVTRTVAVDSNLSSGSPASEGSE